MSGAYILQGVAVAALAAGFAVLVWNSLLGRLR